MGTFRHAKVLFLSMMLGMGVLAGACSSDDDKGGPPQMTPLSDMVAFVDQEFTLEIHASDPDGDALTFDYIPASSDIRNRSDLRPAGNMAVFRWTPIASDFGAQVFDFTVSDGKHTVKETVTIDVKLPVGSSTAPIFRKPLGTGTTLDLNVRKCIDVEVIVEDADSPGVTLGQAEPLIAEATFTQHDGMTGKWSWCPTQKQLSEGDRFALKLYADDGDNPPTIKNFLIVLRKAQREDCPGEAPVIEHTPEGTINAVVDLTIDARVTDDIGLKYEPLLYYSYDKPSNPPDLGQMTQVTMTAISGTMQDGIWAADVPNPVANKPVGSAANVYYVIVAQDNDDKDGDCDHLTQAPATGTFQVEVKNPGGSGGLGLCKACSADVQCGGDGDLCVHLATEGKSYCLKACSGEQDCPANYNCSSSVTSVNGTSAKQCTPTSGVCTASSNCVDDDWEPNDTMEQANNIFPGLEPGEHAGLVICPGPSVANEDWYPIDTYGFGSGTITAMLEGGPSSDLGIYLLDSNGYFLDYSHSGGSLEIVESCVQEDTYFLWVNSWQNVKNTYTLTYEFSPGVCAECQDDEHEPDDNATQARNVNIASSAYTSDTNVICPWNEDWFKVDMLADHTLRVTLAFDQANSKEDLDIILYKGNTNLTPCDETTSVGCNKQNGQSWDSNETLTWPITESGTYYVVVRGYAGSQNLYDVCIGLADYGDCPPL